MTTITDFLLARIAEDEALASTSINGESWGVGRVRPDERSVVLRADGQVIEVVTKGSDDSLAHIARWDPARVLGECEAKRRIVETHLDNESRVVSYRSPRWADDMTDDDRLNWRKAEARCAATDGVVRALVQVYADHPDYNHAWSA